jgi:hypothetical protein
MWEEKKKENLFVKNNNLILVAISGQRVHTSIVVQWPKSYHQCEKINWKQI